MGAPMPDGLRPDRPAELARACPRCKARPGVRCTSPRGRQLRDCHPSRKEAAQ